MSDIIAKNDAKTVPKPSEKTDSKVTVIKKDGGKPKGKVREFFARLKKIKNIEIYIALIIAAIIILIYFSGFFKKKDSSDTPSAVASPASSPSDYCAATEARLKSVLSKIKGAGILDVMIHFESSEEIIIAYITSLTENNNTSGAGDAGQSNKSSSSTSTPQLLQVQGGQIPLILKTVNPKVLGVIVVAKGASNMRVKLDLLNAVSTVLGINANLVNIFPG